MASVALAPEMSRAVECRGAGRVDPLAVVSMSGSFCSCSFTVATIVSQRLKNHETGPRVLQRRGWQMQCGTQQTGP